jgi:hypothetical protein
VHHTSCTSGLPIVIPYVRLTFLYEPVVRRGHYLYNICRVAHDFMVLDDMAEAYIVTPISEGSLRKKTASMWVA